MYFKEEYCSKSLQLIFFFIEKGNIVILKQNQHFMFVW